MHSLKTLLLGLRAGKYYWRDMGVPTIVAKRKNLFSINNQRLSYEAFQEACKIARRDWDMALQSHEEIVTATGGDEPNCVATKSIWSFVEKKSGKRTNRETVIIIITSLDDKGVRKITQWTEVTRDF